ncbi:hypothetical protein [Microbacterium sp. zg-YB36]|uniref:hypothetical protein n=1 Tax=Microbacterium sp. zg-YB36 TaxID=2969407 RepID=UPI00214B1B26|nr:hypothetical protein [Microbacterium sp. zg-YB36]MDL5351055.1 hypothetical protein [Microbacterium sp. zg-YB36]
MNLAELHDASLTDLLALRAAIDQEIAERGHSRTASSLPGELMERAVADAYSATLAPVGVKSFDVITGDGRRIQVKTRSLPKGDMRHWAFSDFEFEVAVVIAFDRAESRVDWARELSADQVRVLARPHASDGWRLRMAPARTAGRDVTDLVSRALTELA